MDIVQTLSPSGTPDSTEARRHIDAERASRRVFFGISAVVFAASMAVTIVGCTSMSSMGGMPMPGGWTMSMTWMRMPGQSWAGAAASFVGMWVVMMKAMMLPSFTPILWRYRQAVMVDAVACGRERRVGGLLMIVGTGYFFIWLLYGIGIFVLGVMVAALEMRMPMLARSVPLLSAAVVVVAGLLQFTPWKARHLACCRHAPGSGRSIRADAATAWKHGVRLAMHCSACTAGLTAVLLVMGVMDLRAMTVVSFAMTVERLAPNGRRVARMVGVVLLGVGLSMGVHAR
ncbi:DUF2182 domain-containing protein [Pararobbsia alpina]|uniref:DUF2182 domain-containing protein n=1 Tax=Pararobbsia alpina TaxID=621374 RepID=UPI0039A56AD2